MTESVSYTHLDVYKRQPVSRTEQRIQEAARLGFEVMYTSKHAIDKNLAKKYNIRLETVTKVDDMLREVFG